MSRFSGGNSSPLVIPGVPVHERRHSRVLQRPLACARRGVMIHYDDSSRDDWAVKWFDDPRCTNGYTWLVLDDGRVVELADPAMRTPHAGACVTPNANSVFYGVSAATNGIVPATDAQVTRIIEICVALMRYHSRPERSEGPQWLPSLEIRGHDEEAIWTEDNTHEKALWGRLGRKVDPTGIRKDRVPIIDMNQVRAEVFARIAA